ncbi:MAG: phosphatase PAP2 family protein [Candidatus Gastranaerophilales bacterium]|nr:phosphatase PAP2 family protein [Candidatus Gastranaerophilales bacterium]
MYLKSQISYLLLLQHFREMTNGILDHFFLIVTMFGEFLIPLLFVSCIYWCVNKKDGVFLLFTVAISFWITQMLKMTACIYRPWILNSEVHPIKSAMKMAYGYSFPSGHTANSMAVWGGYAFLKWDKKVIRNIFFAMVVLVAFSRNYIGVHTPQDVIVSIIVGVGVWFIAKYLINWINNGKNRDVIAYCVAMALTCLYERYVLVKNFPIDYLNGKILVDPAWIKDGSFVCFGYLLGFFTGWIVERKFINFVPENGTVLRKIFRFLTGALVIGLVLGVGEKYLIDILGYAKATCFLLMFLGLFITAIYPFIIKKMNL